MSLLKSVAGCIKDNTQYRQGKFRYDTLDINLTGACTFDCLFCECRELDAREDLSTGEICALADQMAAEGIGAVFLGGGEPFLRKDLVEIIRYFNRKKINISMITNGSLPQRIDDTVLKALDDCVDSIDVSVDSAIEGEFNKLRNSAKGYQLAVDSLERLSSLKKTGKTITAVITRENLSGLPGLVDVAVKHRFDSVVFQPISDAPNYPELKPKQAKSDLFLNPDQTRQLKDTLDVVSAKARGAGISTNTNLLKEWVFQYFENRSDGKVFYHGMVNSFRCIVAFRRATVRHNGDLQLCALMPSIGSIRKQSLHELLYGENQTKEMLRRGMLHKNCFKCFCGMSANIRFSMTYQPLDNLKWLLPVVLERFRQ